MITLSNSTPFARKEHTCHWCDAKIKVGTKYHRSANLSEDGDFYEWIGCTDCQALCGIVWDWAGQPEHGVDTETMLEWAQDHADDEEHGRAARALLERTAKWR